MNPIKRFPILLLSLVLLTVATAPVWARDLCIGDGSSTFVFRKVKTLRPGGAIALTGLYFNGFTTVPVEGGATMRSDGTVAAGVFVHSADGGLARNSTLEWVTNSTLAGTVPYDNDGDFLADDGVLNLSVIDCKMIVLP
jgi:hypothetical protein